MKIHIKFNNDDPYTHNQNKLINVILLIFGIPSTLIGGGGLIVDSFFPSFSDAYDSIAGQNNIGRLLTGLLLLCCWYLLRQARKNVSA